jgi:CRP-like cAMP-binding protein
MEPADRDVDATELGRIPFLADLSPQEIAALCPAAALCEAAADEVIFREGDPSSELFLVLDGEVAIELRVGGVSPRLLTTLGRGTVFGEINFLLGTARTASARALRATRCVALDRASLDALEGVGSLAVGRVMEKLARVLALRLAHVDRQVAELGRRFVANHPEASRLVEDFERERVRLLHTWQG